MLRVYLAVMGLVVVNKDLENRNRDARVSDKGSNKRDLEQASM